jgi:hypothetical protein
MATAAAILALLKDRAQVQTSEELSDAFLTTLIDASLAEHNPSLSYSLLPANQVEPVLLLSWSRLANVRAGRFASDGNLSGPAGFGQDRSTPFAKNMQLAAELRKQYLSICIGLGIAAAGESSGVVVSDAVVPSDIRLEGALVEHESPAPPAPVLTITLQAEPTEVVASWTFPGFDRFEAFLLVNSEGDDVEAVYQDWNYISQSTVPRISNLATLISTIYQTDIRAVKVTNLNREVDQAFLLVVRTLDGMYSYSNQVTVHVPGEEDEEVEGNPVEDEGGVPILEEYNPGS